MTNSSYYRQGYRDALRGDDCSPPGNWPFYTEYCNGYRDAMRSLEPFPRAGGPNDTFEDYYS